MLKQHRMCLARHRIGFCSVPFQGAVDKSTDQVLAWVLLSPLPVQNAVRPVAGEGSKLAVCIVEPECALAMSEIVLEKSFIDSLPRGSSEGWSSNPTPSFLPAGSELSLVILLLCCLVALPLAMFLTLVELAFVCVAVARNEFAVPVPCVETEIAGVDFAGGIIGHLALSVGYIASCGSADLSDVDVAVGPDELYVHAALSEVEGHCA